jgi:hypothetical protein
MNEPEKGGRTGLWIGVTIIAILAVVGIAAASPSTPASPQSAAVIQASNLPTLPAPPQSAETASTTTLSNDHYYTNVSGTSVHSPAYSNNGCSAAGATAECGDGTCSFSQHHSGTCSHHGGVSLWLQ